MRYSQQITVFTLWIFIFFTGGACTKQQSEAPTFRISEEFAAFTAFDSASFWVYQRVLPSALTDTVKIYQINHEQRFYQDNHTSGYYYQAFDQLINYKDIEFTKAEISVTMPADSEVMNGLYRIYFTSGRYYSVFVPHYPLGEIQHLGENEGDYTNVSFFENLTIGEKN